ncbi:MAG: hypothetical protein ACFFEM_16230, partial [Candidatus Thorarchaeota archaeon]
KSRNDIPLAFIVDSSNNKLITSFSRPKPLFKDSQVREFLLVHSTLMKTLENLGLNSQYSYFVIEADDYAVVACNGGRLLSVASGAMKIPIENVYEAATSICYADVFDPEMEPIQAGTVISETTFQDGKMISSTGIGFSGPAQIFVSSLVKNVDSLFRSLTRRPFKVFTIRIIGTPSFGLLLSQTVDGLKLQITQF